MYRIQASVDLNPRRAIEEIMKKKRQRSLTGFAKLERERREHLQELKNNEPKTNRPRS